MSAQQLPFAESQPPLSDRARQDQPIGERYLPIAEQSQARITPGPANLQMSKDNPYGTNSWCLRVSRNLVVLGASYALVLQHPHNDAAIFSLAFRRGVRRNLPAGAHRAGSQDVGQRNLAFLLQKLGDVGRPLLA